MAPYSMDDSNWLPSNLHFCFFPSPVDLLRICVAFGVATSRESRVPIAASPRVTASRADSLQVGQRRTHGCQGNTPIRLTLEHWRNSTRPSGSGPSKMIEPVLVPKLNYLHQGEEAIEIELLLESLLAT